MDSSSSQRLRANDCDARRFDVLVPAAAAAADAAVGDGCYSDT